MSAAVFAGTLTAWSKWLLLTPTGTWLSANVGELSPESGRSVPVEGVSVSAVLAADVAGDEVMVALGGSAGDAAPLAGQADWYAGGDWCKLMMWVRPPPAAGNVTWGGW